MSSDASQQRRLKASLLTRRNIFLITKRFALSSITLLRLRKSNEKYISDSVLINSAFLCCSSVSSPDPLSVNDLTASCRNSSPAQWMASACCWRCCAPSNSVRTPSPEAARSIRRTWICATINHTSDGLCWMNLHACECKCVKVLISGGVCLYFAWFGNCLLMVWHLLVRKIPYKLFKLPKCW